MSKMEFTELNDIEVAQNSKNAAIEFIGNKEGTSQPLLAVDRRLAQSK